MSCNGCRVLRKGCNENCILRQSLQGIESPQAQAHATVFVAKFFGRAGLMSFLSSVPHSHRPALFQSLLFEACGRTVNPVTGAVGLLWTGNWHVCQSAVETVLRGGVLRPIPELSGEVPADEADDASNTNSIDLFGSRDLLHSARKIKHGYDFQARQQQQQQQQPAGADLNMCPPRMTAGGRVKRRAETPSLNSDESETTTLESGSAYPQASNEAKLLRLFF
ncbi:LOB domain-containing protein 37-like [Diospyros lotus]|uniref:LOB domain-containing protein 37-like n=1 Tax=Diospyros lotus TaxID=55363 RepID=UPI00224CA35F|nr:LOB domain-containing protein 37-like [Diospyros lotus]